MRFNSVARQYERSRNASQMSNVEVVNLANQMVVGAGVRAREVTRHGWHRGKAGKVVVHGSAQASIPAGRRAVAGAQPRHRQRHTNAVRGIAQPVAGQRPAAMPVRACSHARYSARA